MVDGKKPIETQWLVFGRTQNTTAFATVSSACWELIATPLETQTPTGEKFVLPPAWQRFSSSLIGVIPGLTGRDFSTPPHAKNEEKVCETNSGVEIGWICIYNIYYIAHIMHVIFEYQIHQFVCMCIIYTDTYVSFLFARRC